MFVPSLVPVQVGTRVYTHLYSRGAGIVMAVHGKESPTTVRSLSRGGAIVSGGSASYDIVFACGSISRRLPEAILRGVQWRIDADKGLASPEEIAFLRTHAEEVEAEKVAAEARAKADHAAEVAALRVNPDYAHLEQGDDSSGTLAAKNIRRMLKKAFPKVKFSVRKSHYGSVTVRTEEELDETATETLQAITSRFKSGYYDWQSDCHLTSNSPWQDVFGSSEYVSD